MLPNPRVEGKVDWEKLEGVGPWLALEPLRPTLNRPALDSEPFLARAKLSFRRRAVLEADRLDRAL